MSLLTGGIMFGIKDLRTDGFLGYVFKTFEDAEKYKQFLCTLGWEEDVISIESIQIVDDIDELTEEIRNNL